MAQVRTSLKRRKLINNNCSKTSKTYYVQLITALGRAR